MNKIIDRTLFFRWGESSTCLEVSGDVFFFDTEGNLRGINLLLQHNVGSVILPVLPSFLLEEKPTTLTTLSREDFSFEVDDYTHTRAYLCDNNLVFSYTNCNKILDLVTLKITKNLYFILNEEKILQYIVVTDVSSIPFAGMPYYSVPLYLKEKEVRELYFLTYTLASDDVVQYVSILEKIQKNDYYDGQLERVANDLVNDLDEWLTIIAE